MKCFHVFVEGIAACKYFRGMLKSIATPNEVVLPLLMLEPVIFRFDVEVLILAIIENTNVWTEVRNNMLSNVIISSDPSEVY